ncbi:hypothetical protein C7B69_10850 [filamentous cyanobacterium Phorm 46]|nr:hypothetical protein C7B69_10850 [filamentous cyanobacterium Phorm 46]PSB51433.1 hypothetical protein C7B67_10835 [filamentous cyanobacterium Phorm 6]
MSNLGVSYLLWAACFFGPFGLHRLYNGKIATGLLWLCTFGLFGFGQLFDLLLLTNMVDEHNASFRGKLGVSPEGMALYPVSGAIASTYPKQTPEQLGLKLLKAAYTKNGRLSVTQGVMATGATFAEVEEAFTAMLKTGYLSIENDSVTGVVIYHFHEL